jgi:hypothetical protein
MTKFFVVLVAALMVVTGFTSDWKLAWWLALAGVVFPIGWVFAEAFVAWRFPKWFHKRYKKR